MGRLEPTFESDRDLAGIRDAFAVALSGITCAELCDAEARLCGAKIPKPVESRFSGMLLPNENGFVCVQLIAVSRRRAWLLEVHQ